MIFWKKMYVVIQLLEFYKESLLFQNITRVCDPPL